MANIHPTAIIDAGVELADDVVVGPYAVIQGKVTIGAATQIHAHSVIKGCTAIGQRCAIGPAAYVGMDPQHLGYKGEPTWLTIGNDTILRENASVHRAFKSGIENATKIGNHCFIMGTAHVGHDCVVEDHVIIAHGAMLGGHVTVGPSAFLGGNAGIHQFCRMGRLAILKGGDVITKDLPPFAALAYGGLRGYNAVGCRRAGLSRQSIGAIRQVYQIIHSKRTLPEALKAIRDQVAALPEVAEILQFIAGSKRGIVPSAGFLHARLAGAPAATLDDDEIS